MSRSVPLIGNEYVVGFRRQVEWATLIAAAFFFGKIGAGLFMMSVYTQSKAGMAAGLAIVLGGKGGAHFLFLGKPWRFWRGMSRPGTSWVSRGLWSMTFMTIFGGLALVLPEGSPLYKPVIGAAAFFAFIVAVYDGFLLTSSNAIPIWNSALMPVMCMFYAFLGGTTLTLFLAHFGIVQTAAGGAVIHNLEVILLSVNLAIVLLYLLTSFNASGAANRSFDLLIKGEYALPFFALAIGVGLVFTLLMTLFAGSHAGPGVVALVTVADLVGHYLIFFLLLKVGVFKPVMGLLKI